MKLILETERLLLREYTEGDAADFLRLNGDSEVLRFTGDEALADLEQARTALREHPIRDYRLHGVGRWACVLRASGDVIGFAGLKYLPETGEIDLGYRLLPATWGRGLATEACKAVIDYGFGALRLAQITALVQPENVASIRVVEKCGLAFTGTRSYRGFDVRRYLISRPASTAESAR